MDFTQFVDSSDSEDQSNKKEEELPERPRVSFVIPES